MTDDTANIEAAARCVRSGSDFRLHKESDIDSDLTSGGSPITDATDGIPAVLVAESFTGKCVEVADGDSITVLYGKERVKI